MHLRLNAATAGSISAGDLAGMKPTAIFVNASRAEPKRLIIFLAYGIALVAAMALVGIAAMRTRRPRHLDHARKAGR